MGRENAAIAALYEQVEDAQRSEWRLDRVSADEVCGCVCVCVCVCV